MADLLAFVNRTNLPILAQAAIAHAQFLSIHPFTDAEQAAARLSELPEHWRSVARPRANSADEKLVDWTAGHAHPPHPPDPRLPRQRHPRP